MRRTSKEEARVGEAGQVGVRTCDNRLPKPLLIVYVTIEFSGYEAGFVCSLEDSICGFWTANDR